MSDLVIPDVSEFQGGIDWPTLVHAGYPVAIVRAHNGNRPDRFWAQNRAGAHAAGVRGLGIYQYLVAGRDAAVQAGEFCDLVGSLRSGEWPVCDLEEGAGDQSGRAHAWYQVVAARLGNGAGAELYSGDYFFGAHRLGAAGFKRVWLAAYRASEPSAPHELWQFTDARAFPGVPGRNDASVFHGTVEQLLAHINPQEDDMPYTPDQLISFAQQGALAALESQPGRDALAYADLWWLDHALAGTSTPGMNPGQVALIQDIHKLVTALKATTPPVKQA